jgi:hypothetical protein
MPEPKIRHLKNCAIDRKKWDDCIRNSPNGNLYSWSWYLDLACPGWEALVAENYETVMPLPVRKKFSLKYLYQPFFVQQLGVFSVNTIKEETLKDFINSIPSDIKYTDYNLNFCNSIPSGNYSLVENTTHHLNLTSEYDLISRNYPENTRRNIRKAEQGKLRISKGIDTDTLIAFKQKTAKADLDSDGYNRLGRIVSHSVENNSGEIYGAFTSTDEMCAAAFFAYSHQYAYMLVAASDDAGKENSAQFLLIDTFIREHSGKKITLDFEGSNIPGIARFFAGFGAVPVHYHKLRFNRLPFYIKWFKK